MASLEFYVKPEELIPWILHQILHERVWCQLRFLSRGFVAVSDPHGLNIETLNDPELIDLFIGTPDLQNPVWKETARGLDLSFVESMALQLRPSHERTGRVLLEGRLAMSRPTEYEIRGVDPAPLTRWYHQMRRSLSSIMSKSYVLTQTLTDGTVKDWPGIRVSPGAVEWRQAGGLLKQFVTGPVEFDIRHK